MLNLTRLHLGIAHESQFQGLGISPPYELGECCLAALDVWPPPLEGRLICWRVF
jgi:hypothetical protein